MRRYRRMIHRFGRIIRAARSLARRRPEIQWLEGGGFGDAARVLSPRGELFRGRTTAGQDGRISACGHAAASSYFSTFQLASLSFQP